MVKRSIKPPPNAAVGYIEDEYVNTRRARESKPSRHREEPQRVESRPSADGLWRRAAIQGS
jgi:hypothetical protein